jgi:HSP20 family molecular chaperone IbpA
MFNTLLLDTLTNNAMSFPQSNFKFVETIIKDDTYELKFNVAGFEKEELKIEFTKKIAGYTRQVKIIGESKEFGITKQYGEVSSSIDEKSVQAVLKNGILKISCCEEKVKSPLTSLTIQIE